MLPINVNTLSFNKHPGLARRIFISLILVAGATASSAQVRATRLTVSRISVLYVPLSNATLRCTLQSVASGSVSPLANQQILWTVRGAVLGVSRTGSDGVARFSIRMGNYGPGVFTVRCDYYGQAGYYGNSWGFNTLQIYR